jgi:hypothetical protein
VEIVQRPLWDSVLYFDRTFNVLFFRELHLVVFLVRIFPLALLSRYRLLFQVMLSVGQVNLVKELLTSIKFLGFLQRQRLVILIAHVELSGPPLHKFVSFLAILGVLVLCE